MLVNFYKYQGTGNDFVIIDLRSNNIQLSEENIKTGVQVSLSVFCFFPARKSAKNDKHTCFN